MGGNNIIEGSIEIQCGSPSVVCPSLVMALLTTTWDTWDSGRMLISLLQDRIKRIVIKTKAVLDKSGGTTGNMKLPLR